MDITQLNSDLVIYPDGDGQPMTESDATRDYLIYAVEVLRLHFESRRQVYVSGNLFIYYEEGNPKAVVSPDVFVIFGVSSRPRRSYKTWQEDGKLPSFILEITSNTTKNKDEQDKPQLYQRLGVQEYFQYDPTADYLTPQLKGRQLVNGAYEPLPLSQTAEGIPYIASAVLGLDLHLRENPKALGLAPLPKALRFYDPQTGVVLPNRQEVEEQLIEAQQERDTAQQERDTAQQERDVAQQKAQRLAQRLRELGIDPEEE
jgi:Uma2 family endonuclease